MKYRIGVVGAGAAGLCAGRHMIHSPDKYDFVIFEQAGEIGGTWMYTSKTGMDEYNVPIHSNVYKNLRTNVPKEIMGYPDFPFSNVGKSFIHHSQVLSYLKEYANKHGLYDRIKCGDKLDLLEIVPKRKRMGDSFKLASKVSTIEFRSRVKSVTPEELSPGKRTWKVVVTHLQSGIDKNYEFDGVMVCNGHYAAPNIPVIEGIECFKGETMHSHYYREPEIFKGKTLVVLGAASSGMDIAIETSSHAKEIHLSHNKEKKTAELPNNVVQKPGIKMATEDGFYFLDDSFVKADLLIYCTGYKYNFPFLTEKCNVRVEGNRVMPMYKHLIHMDYPELCFIGLPFNVLPFPLFHYQVLYYLKSLDGEMFRLPDRKTMEEETEKDFEMRVVEMKMLPKHAHKMGSLQWDYFKELSELTDVESLPPVHQTIFQVVDEERANNVMFYKREDYRLLSSEEYVRIIPET